jgi:condensin complex subunit 3
VSRLWHVTLKVTNDVRSEVEGQTIDDGVHLELAEDILKALFNDDMESASCLVWCGDVTYDGDVEEDKKVLCQVLGRLHLPETVDDDKIRTLKLLVHNVFTVLFLSCARFPTDPVPRVQRRPIRDVSARNALSKFDTTISKKYADKLAGFSEEDYRRLEQLDALFRFLDDIVPLDDGEEMEPMRTRGRKRWVVVYVSRPRWC